MRLHSQRQHAVAGRAHPLRRRGASSAALAIHPPKNIRHCDRQQCNDRHGQPEPIEQRQPTPIARESFPPKKASAMGSVWPNTKLPPSSPTVKSSFAQRSASLGSAPAALQLDQGPATTMARRPSCADRSACSSTNEPCRLQQSQPAGLTFEGVTRSSQGPSRSAGSSCKRRCSHSGPCHCRWHLNRCRILLCR